MARRSATGTAAALLLALLAFVMPGCAATEEGPGDGPLAVYLSVPLTGSQADAGKAVAAGAREALAAAGGKAGEREISLQVLDDTGGQQRWTPVAVGENARLAAEDADTIAYIGELEPEATRTSAPITDRAEIAQLVLGTVPEGLDEENLVSMQPGPDPKELGSAAITLVLRAIEAAGDESGDREVVLQELRDAAASSVAV